jgi:hypothetical protein
MLLSLLLSSSATIMLLLPPIFDIMSSLIAGNELIRPIAAAESQAAAATATVDGTKNAPSSLELADSLREGNLTYSYLNINDTSYHFSSDLHEISTPDNNTHTGDFGRSTDIALIRPMFTAAAYDNAFYIFYPKYTSTPKGTNVTTDLDLLSNQVTNQTTTSAFAMLDLLQSIHWLTPESNVTVLADQDADSGGIFLQNGSNAYDVVILGHQEYVTQQEYDNLKRFVANGGTMIILDGNVFYAQVDYNENTEIVRLVKGHGWAYNEKSAWKSIGERWANETAQWVGSNYLCYSCNIAFANDPFRYQHHEENYVTNPNDIILLDYNATDFNYKTDVKHVIATYELNYQKGKVIALGIYSDDIITNGKFDRFFDSLLLQYAPRVRD